MLSLIVLQPIWGRTWGRNKNFGIGTSERLFYLTISVGYGKRYVRGHLFFTLCAVLRARCMVEVWTQIGLRFSVVSALRKVWCRKLYIQEPPKGVDCEGGHPRSSTERSLWKREKFYTVKALENLSFPKARRKVMTCLKTQNRTWKAKAKPQMICIETDKPKPCLTSRATPANPSPL